MSVVVIEMCCSILFIGWCLLVVIVLVLVIVVGVSVGELVILLQNVFYVISNRIGLIVELFNCIYESVIWDFCFSCVLVVVCCGVGFVICGVVL